MDKKRTEKLLGYIHKFNFMDLIAFGTILEVEQIDDLEEYVTNILVAFNEKNRCARRDLLRLAKDVALANKDILNGIELENKDKDNTDTKDAD